MDPKALVKALSRLRVVQKAVADLEICKDYDAFSDIWYTFLVAAKNVYTVLEQGAKTTPQSRQWFGSKNQQRKNDPLLRYVTEARNDDEHGLEPISTYVPSVLNIGVTRSGTSSHMKDENGNVFIGCGTAYSFVGAKPHRLPGMQALDGKPILVEDTQAHVKLVRVHDRSRNPHDPPTSHLGEKIDGSSPLVVAKAMTSYLETLVAEAQGFEKPLL